MNAITPIISSQDACWAEAQRQINEWRGNITQRFARGEIAVSETLVTLHETARGSEQLRLQQLTGQRFQGLEEAIGSAGLFAQIGECAREPLAAFRSYHEDLRPYICHGCGKIALDRKGRWVLILEMLNFQANRPERRTRVISQPEAQPLLDAISTASNRLVSALGNVRKAAGTL